MGQIKPFAPRSDPACWDCALALPLPSPTCRGLALPLPLPGSAHWDWALACRAGAPLGSRYLEAEEQCQMSGPMGNLTNQMPQHRGLDLLYRLGAGLKRQTDLTLCSEIITFNLNSPT